MAVTKYQVKVTYKNKPIALSTCDDITDAVYDLAGLIKSVEQGYWPGYDQTKIKYSIKPINKYDKK